MSETSPQQRPGSRQAEAGDPHSWHLGRTPEELALGEFQHALICLAEAFYRFAGKSLAQVSGNPNFTGQDSVILNIIQTQDRPKSITELQHFTNRTDVANIQYSVKKLMKAGLIEKAPRGAGRGTNYRITDKGRAVTEAYVHRRRAFLDSVPVEQERLLSEVENARRVMVMLTGLYDQESRAITTQR